MNFILSLIRAVAYSAYFTVEGQAGYSCRHQAPRSGMGMDVQGLPTAEGGYSINFLMFLRLLITIFLLHLCPHLFLLGCFGRPSSVCEKLAHC